MMVMGNRERKVRVILAGRRERIMRNRGGGKGGWNKLASIKAAFGYTHTLSPHLKQREWIKFMNRDTLTVSTMP